ncbi:MAG: hypothetical protein IPO22_00265 [Anaerolineales bacterium]|nr:hypothetical protein [Anaerolineales bacterium]
MSANTNPKQKALVIALIILGVLFTIFFGIRALRAFRKFDGHRPPPHGEVVETDVEKIEDWMTVPFISQGYEVPPDVIFEALEISGEENHRKSLKQLNDDFYPGQDGYVLKTVKAVILAHQTALTAPAPPEPPAAP